MPPGLGGRGGGASQTTRMENGEEVVAQSNLTKACGLRRAGRKCQVTPRSSPQPMINEYWLINTPAPPPLVAPAMSLAVQGRELFINVPRTGCLPFSPHPGILGVTSQILYLPSHPCLRFCCWENPTSDGADIKRGAECWAKIIDTPITH